MLAEYGDLGSYGVVSVKYPVGKIPYSATQHERKAERIIEIFHQQIYDKDYGKYRYYDKETAAKAFKYSEGCARVPYADYVEEREYFYRIKG